MKKITNKVMKYSGIMFSFLKFEQGVAFTSDPRFIAYFERQSHKYDVEDVQEEKTEEATEEKPEQVSYNKKDKKGKKS